MLEERAAQGLPPKSTVYGYLDLWNWDGTLERIHHVLCVAVRKRHILVDTLGLLLSVAVHSASIQDRDGVERVLDRCTRRLFPFIERIYGDGGYRGPKAATGAAQVQSDNVPMLSSLDRRTHLRLDQLLPAPGARLRALRQNRRRLHPSRHDPHHAQAACCKSFVMNPNFADGLLRGAYP
jgi:transposase